MARTKANARRQHQKDQLRVRCSSGYTIIVQRPPINVIRAVTLRAEEMYPDPDPPTESLDTLPGKSYEVVIDDDPAYQQAKQEVVQQRLEHLLEYVFQRRLTVEGYDTEEAKQELVASFTDERAELEDWGDIPEDMADLDDWQFVLRMFIVADQTDYAALMLAASKAMDESDLNEGDIRKRVSFL